MEFIKDKFTGKEFKLIQEVLNTGRIKSDGTKISWNELAIKFDIKPEGNRDQRRKAANDIWRKFIRISNNLDLNLEIVKQTLNGNGEILFETRKKPVEKKRINSEEMVVDKITTSSYGGEWVTYKSKNEDKSILPAIEKLMKKYPSIKEVKYKKFEDLSVEPTEGYTPMRYLAVVNLYDAHLDKIPIKSTCGVESTLEQNVDLFKTVVSNIGRYLVEVKMNGEELDQIIFPIGNDLFHTNGFNSQTKKGTQLEYYCNPEEAYYTICDIVTWAVNLFSNIAPTKVLMIKGNHDEDKITTLGYWLSRYFAEHPNVEVDYLRRQRKYIKYGENLIGFAHGDKEKMKMQQLPLIMAQEAKEYWGNTTYRKMYLGDLHHGFEYQFLKSKDHPGVEVEYLRSCGTTDTWHEDFGWIGVPKTGYLQLFDYEEGEVNRIKYPIKDAK